jgi:hypothetical protein
MHMKALVVPTSALILMLAGLPTHGQQPNRLALKSGETQELQTVYWVTNCRSTMQGLPQIDVLESPAEITLSIKEGMVLPRRHNCAKPVKGGTLVLTVGAVTESKEQKLVYRVRYKISDGERQTAHAYFVSLYP